jgi:hypothetical protein
MLSHHQVYDFSREFIYFSQTASWTAPIQKALQKNGISELKGTSLS